MIRRRSARLEATKADISQEIKPPEKKKRGKPMSINETGSAVRVAKKEEIQNDKNKLIARRSRKIEKKDEKEDMEEEEMDHKESEKITSNRKRAPPLSRKAKKEEESNEQMIVDYKGADLIETKRARKDDKMNIPIKEKDEEEEEEDESDDDHDDYIPFGISDEEDDKPGSSKKIAKKKVPIKKENKKIKFESANKKDDVKVDNERKVLPSRNAREKRKSYVIEKVGSESSSSSSEDDSEVSDFEKEFSLEIKEAEKSEAYEEEVEDDESEEEEEESSDEEYVKKKKTNGRGTNGGKSRGKNNQERKNARPNSNGSANSGGSGRNSRTSSGRSSNNTPSSRSANTVVSRAARPQKPMKPYQIKPGTIEVEGVLVNPKPMAKGERKMLLFRLYARRLAHGRRQEMSIEESYMVLAQMKADNAEKKSKKLKNINGEEVEPLEIQKKEKNEDDSDASSVWSEDEWQEMEPIDGPEPKNIEVNLEKEPEEYDWWAVYLRQEVNKRVRQTWEDTHKVHYLCYIAHLQYLVKTVLEERLVPSLILTQLPNELSLNDDVMTEKKAVKIIQWFNSTFKLGKNTNITGYDDDECRYKETSRYAQLVQERIYETDSDRATLLFAAFVSLECATRICVNTRLIPRKWDDDMVKTSDSKEKSNKKGNKKGKEKVTDERNYWVEFWCGKQKKWICVDPVGITIDRASEMEDLMSQPISYILAVDNHYGIRDVSGRYAREYAMPEFRKRRTDYKWTARTLKKSTIRANKEKAELEDSFMQQELVKKPLPTVISHFKNHPLYALERDLLKYEAIYPRPSDQKPLGEIRGNKIYPRATVFTLQSKHNWEKLARSIKEGEKAYKIVKARPNPMIPKEKRVDKMLDLFGFWQTESWKPARVENGRIPRNEHGNVYMYQPNMCPIGAVWIRLPGLPSIARRLNKECVPAVIGWDFNSCTNYPTFEGACVLEEDKDLFIKEWKRIDAGREERERKKREDRIHGNWRTLIKGILRLHHVKNQFGVEALGKTSKPKKKKNARDEDELASAPSSSIIDRTVTQKRQEFSHDDLMKL